MVHFLGHASYQRANFLSGCPTRCPSSSWPRGSSPSWPSATSPASSSHSSYSASSSRSEASVLMQRLSYPTETVLSTKTTRNIIVLSFKDSPREPLRRRPLIRQNWWESILTLYRTVSELKLRLKGPSSLTKDRGEREEVRWKDKLKVKWANKESSECPWRAQGRLLVARLGESQLFSSEFKKSDYHNMV